MSTHFGTESHKPAKQYVSPGKMDEDQHYFAPQCLYTLQRVFEMSSSNLLREQWKKAGH
jgi:hypothetical protein